MEFYNNLLSQEELIENNIPQEMWLPITEIIVPNVQPYYWISTYGNVYSTNSNRYLYQTRSNTNGGHMSVVLSLKDGTTKHMDVHRLVMLAFRYFEGCEQYNVNHKDTCPDHNWIWNLEWCTQSYNIKYAYECGNMPRGEQKFNAILTEEKVHLICKLLCNQTSYKDIIYLLGFNTENISDKEYHNLECLIQNIKSKKAWTHISDQYNIPTNANSKQRFSEAEVENICLWLSQGKTSGEILVLLGYNPAIMDKKDKVNIKSIFSAIRRKKVYKNISDKYF